MSEDVRKNLIGSANIQGCSDTRCAFVFGVDPQDDGWLGLTRSLQRASSPQKSTQASNLAQPQMQGQQQFSGGTAQSRRPSGHQQQLQNQLQGRTSTYPQHQQPHNLISQQLQRMGSNGQNNSAFQLQQMQQMQAMAQQRQSPAMGGQMQRNSSNQGQPPKAIKSSGPKQERVDAKPVPYKLSRWEVLPESGGNVGGNETSISLSLFGARKA